MKGICNQILDLLLRGLPYTNAGIGYKIQAVNFNITNTPNKVNIEIAQNDYVAISNIINDVENKNNFTISGIYLKNNIVSFTHYIGDLFTVKFAKPHNARVGIDIRLEGFVNAVYNSTYKITGIVDDFTVRVKQSTIPVSNITLGLGYYSIEYLCGLNSVTSLEDTGSNIVSYAFDKEYFSPENISDIDTSKKPYINYLYANVLCFDKNEFLSDNLNEQKFIIIDTSSLVLSPHRSNSNKSDANYSTRGTNSTFTRNVSLNLYYIADENTNSSNTDSELTKIDRALNLILRRELEIENGFSTTLTIGSASKDSGSSIESGRLVIQYNIEFYIGYVENNNVLQFQDSIYPIEKVKINNDTVIFP